MKTLYVLLYNKIKSKGHYFLNKKKGQHNAGSQSLRRLQSDFFELSQYCCTISTPHLTSYVIICKTLVGPTSLFFKYMAAFAYLSSPLH